MTGDQVTITVTRAELDQISHWVERGVDDFEYLVDIDGGDYDEDDIAEARASYERVRQVLREGS